jgi:hypothetical protein
MGLKEAETAPARWRSRGVAYDPVEIHQQLPFRPPSLEYWFGTNGMAPYLIMLTAQLGRAIRVEASLSFLGLGTAEPTPSWGLMLSGGAPLYAEKAPWVAIFPGLAISLAVFGFNLFGDSLRDALDPKLRHRKGGGVRPCPRLASEAERVCPVDREQLHPAEHGRRGGHWDPDQGGDSLGGGTGAQGVCGVIELARSQV